MFDSIAIEKIAKELMDEYEFQTNPEVENSTDGLDTVETVRTILLTLIARLRLMESKLLD